MGKFALAAIGAIGGLLTLATPASAAPAEIGNDMSRCAPGAPGAAVLVDVSGFSAPTGTIRVQSYPATRDAWLAKGEWLNRIDMAVRPANGHMRFCMPVPAPGRYAIAVRHDMNGNGRTDISADGGGFSNNPKAGILNLGKPGVEKAAFAAGPGVTRISIMLQYL